MRTLKPLVAALIAGLLAATAWAEGTDEDFGGGLSIRGSGRIISEGRAVRAFDGVELKGAADLTIVRGRTEKLEIEAEDNILDLITSDVEGGVLVLSYKRGDRAVSVWPTRPVRLTLTVRDVARISAFGSGSVSASGLSGDLQVSTFGSGGVRLSAAWLDSLTVSIAGSGGVDAEGTATEQHVTIAGSGDYRAPRLTGRSADVRIAGSGSAVIGSAEELDVTILGSGSVGYYGRPRISQKVLGSGTIRSLDGGG